jgi:hypothetical protein
MAGASMPGLGVRESGGAVEERPQPEAAEDDGQQTATEDDEDFLFEAAKDPRSQLTAAAPRCFCYCYCTKG